MLVEMDNWGKFVSGPHPFPDDRWQESMKMMGMPGWIHWMAWWAKSFIQLLVSICIMLMLLMVDW